MMVIQTITVRKKGQITLPVEVRRDLGIDEGDRIAVIKRGNEYTFTAASKVVDHTAGALSYQGSGDAPTTIEEMDRAVEQGILESWERFVRETEEKYDK